MASFDGVDEMNVVQKFIVEVEFTEIVFDQGNFATSPRP